MINFYKDKGDIIFLSVSIDEDKKRWSKFLRESVYKSNQFHVEKSQLEPYNILELPRAIIINSEFEISDLYAPQPYSTELTNKLEILSKKKL